MLLMKDGGEDGTGILTVLVIGGEEDEGGSVLAIAMAWGNAMLLLGLYAFYVMLCLDDGPNSKMAL